MTEKLLTGTVSLNTTNQLMQGYRKSICLALLIFQTHQYDNFLNISFSLYGDSLTYIVPVLEICPHYVLLVFQSQFMYSRLIWQYIHVRSGYSPGCRASKNYLPGRRVNNLLLARQRKYIRSRCQLTYSCFRVRFNIFYYQIRSTPKTKVQNAFKIPDWQISNPPVQLDFLNPT